MLLSMIAAYGKNRELGLDNKLLWHLPADMKNFVRLTKGKAIVVGRKTFESFKGPLPKRINIILTTNKSYHYEHENVRIVHSVEECLKLIEELKLEETVICGGAEIYKIFLPLIKRFYLSIVDWEGKADTFFPEFDMSDFKILEEVNHAKDEENLAWRFLDLEKV
ncbi:dihydrofolate reductase [Bacteriovorax sp. Seq25_V]|uniref:dihydrofolate reductase n=1 Tax=Bacteriovorax sp. Seq25_V TaxID=1201288 RepID=UPI00038A4B30|nr:dihydrofolate reductase [Bacteriovorax sp. Seq25_V]EQC47682.1 dihydrofolate reductase [Bacteriovorax sp. Seq25_V]